MISLLYQSIKVELLWLSKIFSFQLKVDNSFSSSFISWPNKYKTVLLFPQQEICKSNLLYVFYKNYEIHLKATGGGEKKFVVSLSPLKETFSGQWELFAENFDNFHLFMIKEKYIKSFHYLHFIFYFSSFESFMCENWQFCTIGHFTNE